jgi:leucyl aminopeptidase
MEFSLTNKTPSTGDAACLVLGVYEERRLPSTTEEADRASDAALSQLLKRGNQWGSLGHTEVIFRLPGIPAERILLVGCGPADKLTEGGYAKVVRDAAKALANSGAKDAISYLTDVSVPDRDLFWRVRQVVQLTDESQYQFDQLKSEKEKRTRLKRASIYVPTRQDIAACNHAVQQATAISKGVSFARDLGNLPANVCTPSYLADSARALAKGNKAVAVEVLDEPQMKKLGMGTLLSVTQGSREPAKLIIIEYKGGKKNQQPSVLVGKGVTFDSGGISLKPAERLDEMKFDMCGAASVLGTLSAVIELKLPLNVVGIIPAVENLPGGNATKPGDIVTSLAKQTVEILNTDAEGRLILSDAITYASRFNPETLIDIATLTGACIIALGAHASGLFSNNDALAEALLAAGNYSGDRAWRLPVWEEYAEQLKSNFADVANIGGREAGAITAACFLSRFAKEYRWAHLDIAGTALKTGTEKGATGRPVPLLTQYLLNRVKLAEEKPA